jgi:hypothetical protein
MTGHFAISKVDLEKARKGQERERESYLKFNFIFLFYKNNSVEYLVYLYSSNKERK